MRYRLLSLLMAAVMAFGISGCGGSENNSADPLGTDSLIFGHKEDVEGTEWSMEMQVDPSGAAVLTAKLKNTSGTTVAGREVHFAFAINASGARLSRTVATTDAAGEANILYTAGLTSGLDVVRAWISNSASMDANIHVRSSSSGSGTQMALTSSSASLAAGQAAIITAAITNSTGSAVAGQTVTFAIFANNSGGSITALNGGLTDASGRALAVYTAGANNPTANVQDIVQASIPGSTGAIIITRTSSTGGGGTGGIVMTVTATPSTVNETTVANMTSIIVATVKNADGSPAIGQAVNFRFLNGLPAPSGARFDVLSGGITNANGEAIAVYTVGNLRPAESVQDVVEAFIPGVTGSAVIITRALYTGTGNRIFSFLASGFGTSSAIILKATVMRTDTLTPVSGESVTFSTIVTTGGGVMRTASGILGDPLTALTDSNGEAYVVYTAPAVSPGYAAIRATIAGGDAATVITW